MARTGRVIAAVAIAIIAAGAAYGAVFLYGQHEAHREIDQAIAALPPGSHVHVDSSRYNPLTQTLVINGLTDTRDGLPRLAVRQVRLREIAGDGSDARPYRIGSVHLEALSANEGTPQAVTADVVDAEDVELLAALPATSTPAAGAARLYQPPGLLRVSRFRRLDAQRLARPGQTLARLAMTDLAPGHLGGASLDGVVTPAASLAHADASDLALDDLDAVLGPHADAPGPPACRLIGHLALSGLAVALPQGALRVGTLSEDDLRGQPLAPPPASGGGSPVLPLLEALASTRLDAGEISLQVASGAQVTLASLHDETGHPSATGSADHRRTSRHVALRGLVLPMRSLPDGPPRDNAIGVLGSDVATLDLDDDDVVDDDARTLDLAAFRLTLRGNGALQLSGRFGNIVPGEQPNAASMANTTMASASLRYEDASLAERWIAQLAKARNTTPDQLRGELHARVALLARLMPNQPDAASVLDGFVDHPRALTLAMAPPTPVTLLGVARSPPQDWATLLGLRISAE